MIEPFVGVPLCIDYCLPFVVNYDPDNAFALRSLGVSSIGVFKYAAGVQKAKDVRCWPKHFTVLIKPCGNPDWAFQSVIFDFNCQLFTGIKICHVLPKLSCHFEQTFFCLLMHYFCLCKLIVCFVS